MFTNFKENVNIVIEDMGNFSRETEIGKENKGKFQILETQCPKYSLDRLNNILQIA